MICIYHSRDLDGFTSGAIVKRKYPEAKLIGYDYGQDLPLDQIPAGEPIIMVDVSMPMDTMNMLNEHSNHQFTWIDHHISAINDYYSSPYMDQWEVALENGKAACEISWDYFFPEERMPEFIELLGMYDTWRNQDKIKWDRWIMPFQFGMRQICNSPETLPSYLFKDNGSDLVAISNQGKSILSYKASSDALMCKRAAFEAKIGGMRAICINSCGLNSDAFKSVYDEKKHDVMVPFFFDGKKWIFSLYTTHENVDCSIIAKKMGGGGHKGAAGFEYHGQLKEVLVAD